MRSIMESDSSLHPIRGVQYAEVEVPKNGTYCNDRECTCNRSRLENGEGYLIIHKDFKKFRKDCLSLEEFQAKQKKIGIHKIKHGKDTPRLVCKLGAERIKKDLATARIDAAYWWDSGKIPLRETPKK